MNAIDLLTEVMQHQNWYKDVLERRHAAVIKLNSKKGKVSYSYACKLLQDLGWHKISEEKWEK